MGYHHNKMLTYDEYRAFEFDDDDAFVYELINGEIVKKASPTFQHQRISRKITVLFDRYLAEHPIGEVFYAPLDVVLDNFNAPQPDVFFVSHERSFILNEAEGIVIGTPDLIVEIISPGSIRRDRYEKKERYEEAGVCEFWLVDANNRSIEVFNLIENRYELSSLAEQHGAVQSTVLAGLEIAISQIM